MAKLNLAYPEAGEVKFEISKFPDGQQDVTITGFSYTDSDKLHAPSSEHFMNQVISRPVKIISRLSNFKDLELILCATAALRGLGVERILLSVPYITGARSDRKFKEGGTSYLRDVVAPIINAQNFLYVECWDAHSDVCAAVINRLKINTNHSLFQFALFDMKKENEVLTIISPDAGALKKVYSITDAFDIKQEVVICSKYRDTNGKLSRVNVPISEPSTEKEDHNESFVIVDDICDGGATFLNIAKEVSRIRPDANLYLVVTHGVFSKGLEELSEYFDKIFCTNSFSDIEHPILSQLSVLK